MQMPGIIYGTAWKKDLTASLVEEAINQGFRGIDTACQPKHYHEAGVGKGISACIEQGILARSELYLQTKFTPLDGQDPNRIPYDPQAPLDVQVAQSFLASLENLQTDYLDALILHSPLADPKQTIDVWCAMEDLVVAGGVKSLGISNCYSLEVFSELFNSAEIKPAVIQNRFYANSGYDREIREFCRQYGVIYQSFWTLTANPRILGDATVMSLAGRYNRSPAQIFFRYLTQIGIVPLTGTTSVKHMQEDLAVFDFELTAEDCEIFEKLLS